MRADSRHSLWMAIRLLAAAVVIGTTLSLCASFAFHKMFSFFAPYDDEGAMLIVVDQLAKGHVLYDEVVSMYGPWGFLPKLAIVKLFGLAVTHDLGRSLTLACWLASSAALGVAAWRLGRSIAWFGVGALALCFSLTALRQEPGHPQDVSALILSLAVAASTFAGARRTNWIIILLGGLGGLLTMTKINLGLFFMAALVASQIFHLRNVACRRWLRPLAAAGLLSVPIILMRDYLPQQPAILYALRTILSLAACIAMAWWASRSGDLTLSPLLLCAGSFAASALLVCVVTVAMGTSVNGLIDGILFLPLRLSRSFSQSVQVRVWALPMTVAALAIALLLVHRLAAETTPPRSISAMIGVLRIVLGLSALSLVVAQDLVSLLNSGPAFAWLLLFPLRDRPTELNDRWARMFLAFLAVLESMWAFPVAGSQLAFSIFLLVTAAIVTVADGVSDVASLVPSGKAARTIRTVAAVVILGVALLRASVFERDSAAGYRSRVPLGLPGSELIRLAPQEVLSFRTQVANLRENADVMFTLPGLNSLYFWAQLPPPTPANVTSWMYILSDEQQNRIIRALEEHPRASVLVHPSAVQFWIRGRPLVKGPLLRYLTEHFRVAFESQDDGWLIMVHKERPSVVVVDYDGTRRVLSLTGNAR